MPMSVYSVFPWLCQVRSGQGECAGLKERLAVHCRRAVELWFVLGGNACYSVWWVVCVIYVGMWFDGSWTQFTSSEWGFRCLFHNLLHVLRIRGAMGSWGWFGCEPSGRVWGCWLSWVEVYDAPKIENYINGLRMTPLIYGPVATLSCDEETVWHWIYNKRKSHKEHKEHKIPQTNIKHHTIHWILTISREDDHNDAVVQLWC